MSTESQNYSKRLKLTTRLKLSAHSIFSDIICRPNGTINRRIADFIDVTVPPSSTPKDNIVTSDITIDPSRELWFRLFVPASPLAVSPVILYFHGGGFTFFSPATCVFDDLCRRLARDISCIVISINYRRSPEHKYPTQYDDGFDALKFIDENHIDGIPTNTDLSRCFLAGDSAGRNLAHHTAVRASEYNKFKVIKIKGLILIQPFFGGEERTESEIRLRDNPRLSLKRTDWAWKVFLPDESKWDHPAANVYGPESADLSTLKIPHTMVVVGGLDILQDRQRRYCAWLRGSGKEVELVEYEDMFHGFYVISELRESSMLINEVRGFVWKHR